MTHQPKETESRRKSTSSTLQLVWRRSRFSAALAVALLAYCAAGPVSANAACGRPVPSNLPMLWPPTELLPRASVDHRANAGDNAFIVGLWHVKFMSSGQLYDEGFDAWHSDGTEILNDNGVPPAAGNVCLGVYTTTGKGSYELKHVAWNWDANGNLTGTLIIHESVTLGATGNSYHGSFLFDFYDLSGNLTSQVTGNLSAARITAD